MSHCARLLILAGAALISACTGQSAADRVAVRVSVYRDSVSAGDTVLVEVSVQNIDEDPVTIGFDTNCQLLYRIVDANNVQVGPPNPWTCTNMKTALFLASGEIVDTIFPWIAQVPPGQYRVYGDVGANRAREAGPVPLKVQ